jgi:hypothetical protein
MVRRALQGIDARHDRRHRPVGYRHDAARRHRRDLFPFDHGTGAVTGICRKNATTGSTSVSAGTLVADTYTELAWYWDGKDTVTFYQDKVAKGSVTGVAASYLPDTTCTPTFGVQTDSANARTMSVDYITIAKSRR